MKHKIVTVEILLATHQGERYLKELLNSLITQSYKNWVLSVSDDGSNDGTIEILNNFYKKHPKKVKYINSGPGKGPCHNFFDLMESSSEELLAFCDQDDVWRPRKLEVMVNKYLSMQITKNDLSIPTLVYCDASIVDDKLNLISDSMFRENRINSKKRSLFKSLQFTNCITGCCLLANRSAIEHAIKDRNNLRINHGCDVVMHDHWLGLVTAYHNGFITYIEESLILYRQHETNVIGANESSILSKVSIKKIRNVIAKYNMLKIFNLKYSFFGYFIRHIFHSFRIK